jgi:hypothetical protein
MQFGKRHEARVKIPGERPIAGPMSIEVVAGAASGAAAGAVAGPPGAAVGALIGGAIGVAAGVLLNRRPTLEEIRASEYLDREIGVIGGDIGAAPPDQPPPRIGAFHRASLGVRTPQLEPTDGPIQNVDEE